MNVMIVASEALPFSKTGGLADITGGLLTELEKQNVNMRLIVPAYKMSKEYLKKAKKIFTAKTFLAGIYVEGDVLELKHPENENITVYFVLNADFFNRDNLYTENGKEYEDNAHRFTFFSKVAVELIYHLYEYNDYYPNILHLHDWQTGLLAFYTKYGYKCMAPFDRIKVLFTIHNIAYQGIFPLAYYNLLGIPWKYFNQDMFEFHGKINFLKAGILSSDQVTTVSKNYAKEIQTNEYGFGMQGVMRRISDDGKLTAILNGVSEDAWNPKTDKYLKENTYNSASKNKKAGIKSKILRDFDLKLEDAASKPLITMICRFDSQKGIDLIEEKFFELSTLDAAFIFSFLIPNDNLNSAKNFINRAVRSKNIRVYTEYDEEMAHLLTAASDMFLMPSRFEPCGLNQMYSMKYGSAPIVHGVGGLKDTVVPYKSERSSEATGFIFDEYSGDKLIETIENAIKIYKDKQAWNKIIENAMKTDYSISSSAASYKKLYEKMLEEK